MIRLEGDSAYLSTPSSRRLRDPCGPGGVSPLARLGVDRRPCEGYPPTMSMLAGIGYSLLAADLLLRAQRERRPPAPALEAVPTVRARQATRRMDLDFTRAFSAESNRRASPVFRRPAVGTVHKNVKTLKGRTDRIRDLIRKGAIDPAIRNTAIAVLSKRCRDQPGGWCVPEKDWKGEANALFHFVRKNVRYTKDSTLADTYVHPARTLFDVQPGSGGGGDCDDYTITLGALLMSVGHTVKMRVGAIKSGGSKNPGWNHIWLIDVLPTGGAVAGSKRGPVYPLDASVDRPPGWQAPKSRIAAIRDFTV